MKTSRITSVTSLLAAACVIGLASASPASAAETMSASVYGATVRGSIYSGYSGGRGVVSYSGVLKDTRRSNGHPATLKWMTQVIHDGSTTIVPGSSGPAWVSTSTSMRVRSQAEAPRTARKMRLKYQVCSRTCSSWQYTRFYSV